MSRWLFVVLPLLFACKRTLAMTDAASDAMSSPPPIETDDTPLLPPPQPPPPGPVVDFTPDASASPDDRKKALAALLAGTSPARDLAEHATEPDAGFDSELRKRLTTVEVSSGPVRSVQATMGEPTATVKLPDAARVIAALRSRMRMCYQAGVNSDPSMSGKLTLTVKVKANGEITAVDVAQNTGLSPAVAQCAAGVVRRTQFDPPGGSGSTLTVPITFSQ